MSRREIREQIFKMLFRIEFHESEEMSEQMELFLVRFNFYRMGYFIRIYTIHWTFMVSSIYYGFFCLLL